MLFLKRLDISSQFPPEVVLAVMEALEDSASNDNSPATHVQDGAD